MKITTRLTLLLLSIALIPLLLLAAVSLFQLASMAERDGIEQLEQVVDRLHQRLDVAVMRERERLLQLAVTGEMGTGQWRQQVDGGIDENPLHLVSREGEVLFSSTLGAGTGLLLSDPLIQDPALIAAWQQIFSGERGVVTPFHRSHRNGENRLLIAVPLLSQQQFSGVALVEYGAAWLQRQVEEALLHQRVGVDVNVMVMTGDGESAEVTVDSRVMSSTTPCQFPGGDGLLLDRDQYPSSGVGWRIDDGCNEVLAAWRELPQFGVNVVAQVDRDRVLREYHWVRSLVVGLIAAVVLVVLVISVSLSYLFARRIVRLQHHALAITAGDLQQTIGEYGEDEVGRLAQAMRTMVKAIRERGERLEQAYRQIRDQEQQREALIRSRTRELYRSKNYLDKVIETMRDMLLVTDEEGRITMSNPVALELLGYHQTELEGRPVMELFQGGRRHCQDPGSLLGEEQLVGLRQNLEQWTLDQPQQVESLLETSPLALLVVDDRGMIEMATLEAVRIFGYSQQQFMGMTLEQLLPASLRQQHQQWRTAFESEQGREIGPRSGVAGVTREGEEISLRVGVVRVRLPQGERLLAVIHDELSMQRWDIVCATTVGRLFQHPGDQPEMVLQCKEGGLVPVQLRGEILRDNRQHTIGFVLGMWDLRERKALEAKSNEIAYQGGVGEVSATMLHSIGNLVAALEGRLYGMEQHLQDLGVVAMGLDRFCQQLTAEEGTTPAAVAAGVEQAAHSLTVLRQQRLGGDLEKITEAVTQLTQFVSLQQGLVTTEVWATEFDLIEILRETVEMVRPLLQEWEIDYQLRLDPTLPTVSLPRAPFQRMVVNLLRNSCEAIAGYRAAGEGVIVLIAEQNGAESAALPLRIEVLDNGGGFDPAVADRLFNSGYSTKPQGSGLGLHTSAIFVQSIGGAITADRVEGGARIVLTLPLRTVEETR